MCARISVVELKYSQLIINHFNNTPSTKAAGGRIYSGVFNKDVKVPRSRGGARWYLFFHQQSHVQSMALVWPIIHKYELLMCAHIARLGILIFGSNFWDPQWRQNSNSVYDSEDSGHFYFEILISGESENWNSNLRFLEFRQFLDHELSTSFHF